VPARSLVAAVVAAGVLAACASDAADQVVGGDPAPTTSTTGAPPATPGRDDGGPAVPELLDFGASAVDGSSVDVAAFAGEDLVVWFWAPW
jgi:hypothetical protein